jgi:hypothetical protein
MWAEITAFLQVCFSGACLPASILLLVMIFYWLVAILVGLDIDLGLDVDLDVDADVDADVDVDTDVGSSVGIGFVVLRFFNIGRVPIMVWLGVFGLSYWLVSLLFDRLLDNPEYREQLFYAVQYGVRNFFVGAIATKFFTHPLRDKFEPKEPNRAEKLIGRECKITTSEVTESFGQAEVAAEAAPLRLNVRSQETPLVKGDRAVIVGFDTEKNVYFVRKADAEV